MGSKDRVTSPVHQRGGSLRSPNFSALVLPIHSRRRRCIADALARRRDPPTHLHGPHLGGLL
eukprot:6858857-Pyramimonas_sp.AAC.1